MADPQTFQSTTFGASNSSGKEWRSKRHPNPTYDAPSGIDPYELRDRANVMEILVAEEVERQMRRCPTTLLDYVKEVELETYALNRLPPLYAASHEGLEYQKQRALREYGDKIKTTVRRAFSAIQRDPLRKSTPLVSEDDRTRHQFLIELAAKFPTLEDLEQGTLEQIENNPNRETAARFRRSSPSRSKSHRRSKKAAWGTDGGWDADEQFSN